MDAMIDLSGNGASWLLALVAAAPILGLIALALPSVRGWTEWLIPGVAMPGLLAALILPDGTAFDLPWLLTGTTLMLDATGRVFLLLAGLLWAAAGGFAASYFGDDLYRTRFCGFFLAAMGGNFGLTITSDAPAFLAFFALMGLSAYGLVVHTGSPFARRAANVYLVATLFAEVLVFAGLLAVASPVGDKGLWSAILLAGLGLKAGVVPLHFWLPLAHPAAPAPASAVLSGSMIKAGLLGWLRFLPLGQAALPAWGELLVFFGLLSAFLAVAAGLLQRDPKAILAYSSISQIGWMTLAVGVGLSTPSAWPALAPVVLAFVLHHGLAKGALFLGAGLSGSLGGTSADRIATVAGLALPALSLAGLTASSGAAVKYGFKKAMAPLEGLAGEPFTLVLTLGGIATTLLMARFIYLAWPRETGKGKTARPAYVWWWVVILAGLALPWTWPTLREWNIGVLDHGLAAGLPVLGAVGLAIGMAALSRRRQLPQWALLPPGDLYTLLEPIGYATSRHLAAFSPAWKRLWLPGNRLWAAVVAFAWEPWRDQVLASDQWGWRTSGLAFMFILILLGTVLVLGLYF